MVLTQENGGNLQRKMTYGASIQSGSWAENMVRKRSRGETVLGMSKKPTVNPIAASRRE